MLIYAFIYTILFLFRCLTSTWPIWRHHKEPVRRDDQKSNVGSKSNHANPRVCDLWVHKLVKCHRSSSLTPAVHWPKHRCKLQSPCYSFGRCICKERISNILISTWNCSQKTFSYFSASAILDGNISWSWSYLHLRVPSDNARELYNCRRSRFQPRYDDLVE